MLDGVARLPGRYAIDFLGVEPDGRISIGDPDRTVDAVCYGVPVIAVADARVAAAHDGEPESASIKANPHASGEAAAGNYIALDLGSGRYAVYEHLKPGSVGVKPGDRVRRGQIIGQLGFTGSSTGPHLHFHVADAPRPIGGEGLPFAFDRFTFAGRYANMNDLGSRPWAPRTPGFAPARRAEWPGYNSVIRF
jgi:murein DD-endopeptidase MepM/ murein hydrolase activator NlpD